jgi:hypothetical protein
MSLPRKWITVDPGEMTGYTVWKHNELVVASARPLWEFVYALGAGLIGSEAAQHDWRLVEELAGWEALVVEDWVLYEWSAKELSWDKQDTVRGIGALQFIAYALGRPCTLQPAKIKEQALAAGAQELFRRPLKPNRHANDAIMHGVHYAAKAGEGVAQVG